MILILVLIILLTFGKVITVNSSSSVRPTMACCKYGECVCHHYPLLYSI